MATTVEAEPDLQRIHTCGDCGLVIRAVLRACPLCGSMYVIAVEPLDWGHAPLQDNGVGRNGKG